ncbi:MAG TPA: hypothetical protein VE954_08495 [Oligoflexus sp.]|uniref:hypothetical protein n=1 Tax=Oligoflexus sp. TaxID=1971216 RepID=UPI002D71D3E8|nr:hypothetical protein [Oligoflexus sp.]HYX33142.1 hypothetical protein [Oligoflexus sp.]
MEQSAIFLSRKLKEFIDGRHEGNVNRACFHLGIDDYNSVYRLYHGKVNSPAFFLAYRILKQTDPEKYCELLADFYPQEMETIGQIAGDKSDDLIGSLDKKFALVMSSKLHFSIYARACEHDGTKLDDITRDFGNMGLIVANELLSAGVLSLEKGIFLSELADKDFRPAMSIVKQHGHLHIDLFQDAAPGFRMENPYGGLNEDGIKEMYRALDELASRTLNIFRNPKFQGNIMYLTTILGGPMQNPRKEHNQ